MSRQARSHFVYIEMLREITAYASGYVIQKGDGGYSLLRNAREKPRDSQGRISPNASLWRVLSSTNQLGEASQALSTRTSVIGHEMDGFHPSSRTDEAHAIASTMDAVRNTTCYRIEYQVRSCGPRMFPGGAFPRLVKETQDIEIGAEKAVYYM